MRSINPVKLLLYKHPLKSEREFIEVDRKSFRKIFKELELDYPIEYYIILDGDEIVKDYSSIPKSDNIYIKCVPQGDGGGAFAEQGEGLKIGGAIGAVIGAILITVGAVITGGALATALIGIGIGTALSGLTTFGFGVYLYNYELDTSSFSEMDRPKNSPSIKGSSNQKIIGNKIPVLLGRHLVYPFIASSSYTYSDSDTNVWTGSARYTRNPVINANSKTQYLRMLLCSGYSSMKIHEDTMQIGDVPFSEYEIQYDDLVTGNVESISQNEYYLSRVSENRIGEALVSYKDEYELEKKEDYTSFSADKHKIREYKRTTSENTRTVDLGLLFPQGLFGTTKNGEKIETVVEFYLEWKHVDDADIDANYHPLFATQSGGLREYRLWGNFPNTVRASHSYTFDNLYTYSPEYNSKRQYTIRIRRVPKRVGYYATDDNNVWVQTAKNYSAATYLELIRSHVGVFDDAGGIDTEPISSSIKADLNVLSLNIKATDELNSVVERVNWEGTKYMRAYTGTGSGPASWVSALTSNPASAFLHVLTDPKINPAPIASANEATQIDFESLEAWYDFCVDKELECNVYEVSGTTIGAVLNNICSVAMASWTLVDNKYTIIVDTYDTDIIQYFTPRNSYDYSGTKSFAETADCLTMRFIDSTAGYIEAERYVFYDNARNIANDIPNDDDIVDSVNLYGAMSPEQAFRLGRYTHAVIRLRPEVHTFSTDIEHIMCTRGDRIKLNHDVPLFGLQSGRILSILDDSIDTIGFVSDEYFQFEAGKSYGVTIRLADGTSVEREVQNPEVDTTSLVFTTPISGLTTLGEGDLILFGELGSEEVDLIVEKIEPNGDLGATLSCIEYNEAIYEADTAPIPAYDPKISKGGSSELNIGELPKSQAQQAKEAETQVTHSDQISYSMSAAHPENYQSTTSIGVDPSTFDGNYFIYVNSADGGKIYKKTLLGNDTGAAINTVSSRHPYRYEDEIFYINLADSARIWKKSATDALDGVQVTTNAVSDLVISQTDGTIYYINSADSTLYELAFDVIGNGTQINTTAMADICLDGSDIYYLSSLIIYKIPMASPSDTPVVFYNNTNVSAISSVNSGVIYYLDSTDNIVYKKKTEDLEADRAGTAVQGTASSFEVINNGDIVYVNPNDSNTLYTGLATPKVKGATIESATETFTITGDLTNTSAVITNISVDDLAKLVKGDNVFFTGIPEGATVVMKGNNFLYMSEEATTTNAGATIGVTGSRITLNANRVVVPGTITAELLEVNAINSKETVVGGFPKSAINLNDGTHQYRKADGTVVLDFDADRTVGAELQINGAILIDDPATTYETIELSEGKIKFTDSSGFGGSIEHEIKATATNLDFGGIRHNKILDALASISSADAGGTPSGQIGQYLGSAIGAAWEDITVQKTNIPHGGRPNPWRVIYSNSTTPQQSLPEASWYQGTGFYTVLLGSGTNIFTTTLCIPSTSTSFNYFGTSYSSAYAVYASTSRQLVSETAGALIIKILYCEGADTFSSIQNKWDFPNTI